MKQISFLLHFLVVFLLCNACRDRGQTLELCFGGDIEFGDSYYRPGGPADPPAFIAKGYRYGFDKLAPLLSAADIRIANLETPLAPQAADNPLQGRKRYLHWCRPAEAVEVLRELQFDYLSLANNHTLDQGLAGLQTTFDYLQSGGIGYFGAGADEYLAARPLLLPERLGKHRVYLLAGFEYQERYDQAYHFYAKPDQAGVARLDEFSTSRQIQALRQRDPQAFIICFPHWGRNYARADGRQRQLARALVAAGADLIIGHGAHMLQEIERIDGKWVYYNLGNLVMNTPGRYVQRGGLPYSIILTVRLSDSPQGVSVEARVYPILSDNKRMNYQPAPVEEAEMRTVAAALFPGGTPPAYEQDRYGYYFRVE